MAKLVFISHKDHDGELALAVKGLLAGRVKKARGKGQPRLEFFLSCDAESIGRGTQWREKIHTALKRADQLLLLYTDHRQVWDWCMYESGYYAGKFATLKKVEGLFVVHPAGVVPPGPLNAWQSVHANEGKILAMLREVYRMPRGGSCFNGAEQDMVELAREIVGQVGRSARQEVPGPARLAVELVARPNSPESVGAKPHFSLMVVVDGALAQMLMLPARKELSWQEFFASPAIQLGRLDEEALRLMMGELVTARQVRSGPLPACIFGNVGYRPIVEGAETRLSGLVSATVVFQPLPSNLPAGVSNQLEILSQMVNLTRRFRYEVVEKYAGRIEPDSMPARPAEAPALSSDEVVDMLHSLKRDVERHISEALAAGVDSPMKLLLAFESPTHGDLGAAQLLWHNGYTRLLTLVSEKSADIAAVQEMFRMLRLANFKFLRLSIEELHRQYMRIEAPPEPNVMPQGTFVTPPLPARSAATTGADGHEPPRDVPAGATAPPITVTTFADGIAGGMQWLNELFGRIAQSGGEVGEPVQSK